MRIAFAHDYLTRFGGAERVLHVLHEAYPTAPIFTLIARDDVVQRHFPNADIRTSFAQRFPFSHRTALPLLPFAVESFDTSGYDVVFSATSAFMKGLVTRSNTRHISYVHTPPRYLWEDRSSYARHHIPRGARWMAHPMLHMLRLWDTAASKRADQHYANSHYTKERMQQYYGVTAEVMSPPVDITQHPLSDETARAYALPDEYFLLVSRLAWWKRPDIAIDAFSALGLPLLVVGDGPKANQLRKDANANVQFLGSLPDHQVRELMSGARALVHPSLEDFGITAVEAMAEGTPVIAYGQGGVLESVQDGVSGLFFEDPDPLSMANTVRLFREREWDNDATVAAAKPFSKEIFLESIDHVLNQ